MRLREIAHELRATIADLRIESSHVGGENWKVTSVTAAIQATERIKATGALRSYVNQVLSEEEFTLAPRAEVVVQRGVFDRFNGALVQLQRHAQLLHDAIQTVLPKECPEQIAILLPPEHDLALM